MADVKGLSEMSRALKQLPDKVRKRVVNKALREGARVVADRATDIALSKFHGEGFLAEHITTRRGKGGKYKIIHRVGVEGGGKKSKEFPYYWRFLEFGTSKMPARPFMRPAGEGTVAQQAAVIRNTLKKGIEREAKKLASKSRKFT